MKQKQCKICGDTFTPDCSSNTICKKVHYAECPICRKLIVWNTTRTVEPCSKECRKELTKRNNIKKYGVEHPMQSKEVQQHHKNAMKAKYGVESPLQSTEIKQKAIQSNLKKFGTEWALGSKKVHDKIKETMKIRYGAPTTLESDILRKKVELTCLDKYGVSNPGASNEVRQRTTNTNFLKYGVSNPMQNTTISSKAKDNRIAIHGAYWTDEMAQKAKDTSKTNYGVDNPSKSVYIQNKIKQSLTAKYGENYGDYLLRNISHNTVSNINRSFGKLLSEAGLNHEYEFASIKGYRYDIVIPESRILIEINPTYTHNTIGNHWTDTGLDANYHKRKTIAALEAGYRCIHIFDWDDWNSIIDMLKPRKPIHACDCSMFKLNDDIASEFLAQNHLLGTIPPNTPPLSLGLTYDSELIAVMTFVSASQNSKHDIELTRFCCKTGYAVSGGSQKLFNFATKNLGLNNIISCCYLDKFTGHVYNKLGMDLVETTDPQEIWSKDDKKLILGDKAERLELIDQGWLPVYDCGKRIYEFNSRR